jgi:GNAT superfamily N-acetyltransferase
MVLERVIVHPAYWRRGHGKALLEWGLALARIDGVKAGVCTGFAGDAKHLYLSLGFVKIGEVSVKDEQDPSKQIEIAFFTT